MLSPRVLLVLLVAGWLGAAVNGTGLRGGPALDVSGYRTTTTAQRTEVRALAREVVGVTGFLGIEVAPAADGRLQVTAVAEDSPAARADLRVGDRLLTLAGTKPRTAAEVRACLQQHSPKENVHLTVERAGQPRELVAVLAATSQPLALAAQRAIMGVQTQPNEDGEGVRVTRLTPNLPAAQAGLQRGDLLLKLNDTPLSAGAPIADLLAACEPGQRVSVTYRRGEKEHQLSLALVADENEERAVAFSPRALWKQPVYKLAVIAVAFADVKPNAAVTQREWEEFFFSTGTYRDKKNATGQPVYGSVNDYYREVSCGRFHVEGRVFAPVTLAKPRADYSPSTANQRTKSIFFTEVLDQLLAREGAEALRGYDGLAFIYAGERFATANRGTLFWPHRGTMTYQSKRWNYLICPEGGPRMANISVYCHEFGHILGLPDLYARPENPGSEGAGTWCAMSNQVGNGRPQHLSAWCKEKLGWLEPVPVDPAVRQKLVLRPIEGLTGECFKVLLRPDGSEYLLLENRRKTGFDASLAAEGLLIWRVVGNKLLLEEAHGVEGPLGPRVFLASVPYPSGANDAFTPYTTPSSRSQLGGGTPVHLTQIRRLPDGGIAFHLGYDYQ